MAMDCLGLSLEWEQDLNVRGRLREKKKLLVQQPGEEFCNPSRVNAVANACVLKPVLERLGKVDKFRLPHLDDLKLEVATVHEKCGISAGEKTIYKTTVEIKRLAGLVKRRAARKEVTTQ